MLVSAAGPLLFDLFFCCSSSVFDSAASVLSMPPVHPSPSDIPGLLEDIVDKEKVIPNLEKVSSPQMADISTGIGPMMDVNQSPCFPPEGNASFVPNAAEEHQSFDISELIPFAKTFDQSSH
ncbi:hypothetical protein MLD38_009518 [Melastoma candidum]|uniref:Uncharacterized protein n=1 Tax=Melastoma candidum TaxID=119954 RepID=A0ACB9RXI0_9MYRT|nr:hypothetical protein MLD38_009518 [Melastoma candidum]